MYKVRYYTPDKLRSVFVGQGLSDKYWFTLYQKKQCRRGMGFYRLKSPNLPLRETEKQAIEDLDKYAASHNFIKAEGETVV